MSRTARTVLLLPALAAAALLAACGGGNGDDPSPSALNATVTVRAAGDPAFNGVYATNTLALNEVEKVNPIGGEPETCRFRFSGLQQAGTSRLMDGDIRYIPGNTETRVTFVSIAGFEFRLQGTANAAVDRVNSQVNYNGAVLASTQGTNQTITLTGSIPMRGNRPEGC